MRLGAQKMKRVTAIFRTDGSARQIHEEASLYESLVNQYALHLLGCVESLGYIRPIDDVPNLFDVVRTNVLVLHDAKRRKCICIIVHVLYLVVYVMYVSNGHYILVNGTLFCK
jgi:hypothetical protein